MNSTALRRTQATASPKDQLPLRDLALIYLTLAYETDHDLTEAEMDTITASVSRWTPDGNEQDASRIVREAMTTYVQSSEERVYVDAVETVSRAVPKHQRADLLEDLRHIAVADETVGDNERRMVRDLARAWQLDEEEA